MSKYSEEVRAMASALIDSPVPREWKRKAGLMLAAYAERIEADERAVPVAWQRKRHPADYSDEWRECSKETFDTIKRTKNSPWIVRELFEFLPNTPEQSNDTAMLDWLSLHPRGAEIVIDGQKRDCIFWGISSAPDNTLRESIAAAIQGEKHG